MTNAQGNRGWAAVMVAAILTMLAAIASPAQESVTFSTLFNFGGANGSQPLTALVQGTDGNFYGTTYDGGACSLQSVGCGTVFKISPAGALTTLYNFCSQSGCTDGVYPYAALIQAADGNFYGTTEVGGGLGDCAPDGCGTVFKITSSGVFTTIYRFSGTDGVFPYGALVQGRDKNLYGTTQFGGTNSSGNVFKIALSGTLTMLYSFCALINCADGQWPISGLAQGTDGNFYGTTSGGGSTGGPCGSSGCGTVFRLTPGGVLTTLHRFDSTDGYYPSGTLVQATDGDFYGTTIDGGTANYGTIFKVGPVGEFASLYSFCSQSNCTDGLWPWSGVIQATDGNFYGTTLRGGAGTGDCVVGCGTVFEFTPAGTLTILHNFSYGGPNEPQGALVQSTDGKFYGSTSYGGPGCTNCGGTIFGLSVGLGPFVEMEPASGLAGSNVKILGNGLGKASSVTFNGIPATFTIKSSTLITATVPSGATTGLVQVVTPSGTLSSNVNFQVLP